jgi:hypothetical protein
MEGLMDAIIKCNTEDSTRPIKTDHYPIVTQIDIHAPRTVWKPRRNFRLTDWAELVKTLKDDLANVPPPTEITSIQEFNDKLKTLNEKIQNTIEIHVKLTTLSPYSKRWWMKELADEKKKMQQLGGRSKYHRQNAQHPVHAEYRRQRNRYSEMIRTAKAEHWVEWLEGLDESSIWQASKLVTSPATDAGRARIPTLQVKDPITKRVMREATDNKSKGQLFYDTFFPPPNPNTTAIPHNFHYPAP